MQPPSPLPPPSPVPLVVERPAAKASGVTTYGVALSIGLAVAVGGLGFAAGRMTADEPSTGGGRLAALAAGGGAGFGTGALPDGGFGFGSGAGPGTGADGAAGAAPPADDDTVTIPTDENLSQAEDASVPGDGPPSGGAQLPAGPPGFAFGGLEGTVAEVSASGFILTTAEGGSLDVTTGADTTYARQSPVSADGIAVGDTVRIEPTGPDAASDQGTQLAASVTVTSPEVLDMPGGPSALDIPDSGAPPAMGGGPRGMRGMLVGTIDGIADGTLTLTFADGSAADVRTDESTTFWQEEPATADELLSGTTIRVRPSFGGPMAAGGDADPSAILTAAAVTIVDDPVS